MKIVFLYPVAREGIDLLSDKLPKEIKIIARIRGEDYNNIPPNQDPEIINECKDADILIGPYVTEEILSNAGERLKLIFIPWTGVDRLDFDLIKKYNIPVANSHGNARTVAEFTIALLLTSAKNIIHHDKLLRKGDWSSRFQKMPSIIIRNKTIGLLGVGAIGTECAKLLQGFDVKIIGCRKNPSKTTKEQMSLIEKIFSLEELDDFLKESDIIINSLPLTRETEKFLGENEFKKMRNGTIIINVGRGKTIDEKALYEAIKTGKLFAAGLDPQWNYPARTSVPRRADGEVSSDEKYYPSDYPIHEFDNVVLSPHRAAHVVEGYEQAHWQDVIENIIRIYEGKEPFNLVDLEKGY
ncbi:MAG: hypothetical protein FK731_01565 [Asgard group archaeon]|nr:hypothetical protein [Asgard group archaeon]